MSRQGTFGLQIASLCAHQGPCRYVILLIARTRWSSPPLATRGLAELQPSANCAVSACPSRTRSATLIRFLSSPCVMIPQEVCEHVIENLICID